MLHKNAFTLVELLIVISVIAVLSGVSLTVLNPTRQRNIAQDSVNKSTMYKLAEGIESNFVASNATTYPLNIFTPPLPLLKITAAEAPTDLVYKRNAAFTGFCLCVPSLVTDNSFFYSSASSKLTEVATTCSVTVCP